MLFSMNDNNKLLLGTHRNPDMNLVMSSIVKLWLIAADISVSPAPRKPQMRMRLRPRVSERNPHIIADEIIPGIKSVIET